MGNYPPEEFFSGQALEVAQAIAAEDVARIRSRAQGVDVNAAGRKGMTLLWFAIQEKSFKAIETLVELGAKPDENIAEGIGSAFDYAIYNEDPRFLKAMLEGGLPVDQQNQYGTSLLQRAAGKAASIDHVKLLVSHGANVNLRDSINGSALYDAVTSLRPDIASYLVEKGADVNAFLLNGVSVMWGVKNRIERQQPGSDMRQQFERLRDQMVEKGAKYPPDPPAKVREWAKSKGMKVAE